MKKPQPPCIKKLSFLKKIDILGKPILITHKSKKSLNSVSSGLLTIFTIVSLIIYSVFKLQVLIDRRGDKI